MRIKPRELKTIIKFLEDGALLAFDFDGTLAPIVKHRARAGLSPKTRALLRAIARERQVAVVTGRGLRDIRAKTRGIGRLLYVGNHGAEIEKRKMVSPRAAREWRRILASRLKGIQGVDIEFKTYSLSVHFVQSKNKNLAREKIAAALKSIRGAKIVGGKHVFNLVDPRAPGKGGALEILMRSHRHRRAIFVGDDATDEDVFRLDPRKVLSIKIGQDRDTRAKIILQSQNEVNSLLALIVKSSLQV